MSKGLSMACNYYNKLEAWNDWNRARIEAQAAGRQDLVDKFMPADGASWRKVDKATKSLIRELPNRSAYWSHWTL